MYTLVTRLIAEGWTCKGSCDGTTGAMDGVNRITDGTKFRTRFSGSAGAQSWVVLTDGDGADLVWSYNSAADDRVNFWWSPGGHAAAAATPNQEPTATDQDRISAFFTTTFISLISSVASGDRLVSIWTTADRKNFRLAIARAGTFTTCCGKESYTPATLGAGVTLHPGYAHIFPGDGFTASAGTGWRGVVGNTSSVNVGQTDQFRCRGYRVDGGGALLDLARYTTFYGNSGPVANPGLDFCVGNVQSPLQGSASYPLRRLGLASATSGHEGNVGKMRDWYFGHVSGTIGSGVTYGPLQWIVVNGPTNGVGFIWPWDGSTTVVMA